MMMVFADQAGPDLETLTAVIARSPIFVANPAPPASRYPAGFDDVDVAILEWIASEGRRVGRSLVRM